MRTLEYICDLNAPLERVWAFHNTIDSLFKLTPPEYHAHLNGQPEPMRQGVVYKIKVRKNGIPIEMHSKIVVYDPPTGFVDEELKGPFQYWRHEHRMEAIDATHTRLTDHVTYALPLGPLGALADALVVHRDIERMFAYRHKITRESLENPGA